MMAEAGGGHDGCGCNPECRIALQSGSQMYYEMLRETIDKMIGGGMFSGEITEIAGPPGSGKTQFCLTFIATVIMNSGCRVLYVDTTGAFSSFRLYQVLLCRNPHLDQEAINEHIRRVLVVTVADYDQLTAVIDQLFDNVDNIRFNLKAVIIDHIGTILSPLSWVSYKTGMQKLFSVYRRLREFARDYHVCVLVVNLTTESEEQSTALGVWWDAMPNTRLIARPRLDGSVVFELTKSFHAKIKSLDAYDHTTVNTGIPFDLPSYAPLGWVSISMAYDPHALSVVGPATDSLAS